MNSKKWSTPPIFTATMRLQEIALRLQRLSLLTKIKRAETLLKTHLGRKQ